VNSCCLEDTIGPYSATLGMAYAYSNECNLAALPSNISGGLCDDPILAPGTSTTLLRCCCK
jgi:hypothetical protein